MFHQIFIDSMKTLAILLVSLLLTSCSATLSVVDYDDLYTRNYRNYVQPRPIYPPYRWYFPSYDPFYYYQRPNIVIVPQYPLNQAKPGIEGGRRHDVPKGNQRPPMGRGSRGN